MANPKYKVGDVVILHKHQIDSNGRDNWSATMEYYVGKKATITYISSANYDLGHQLYSVDIDGGSWEWREEAFTQIDKAVGQTTTTTPSNKSSKCAVCTRCKTPAPWMDYDPSFKCYSCRH
jgi:hypothetical protein